MERGWRSPVLFPLRDERRRVERRVRDLLFLGQPPLPPQEVSPLFFPPSRCLLFFLSPLDPHTAQQAVEAGEGFPPLPFLFFTDDNLWDRAFQGAPALKRKPKTPSPPKKEGEEGGREGKLSAVKRSLGEI